MAFQTNAWTDGIFQAGIRSLGLVAVVGFANVFAGCATNIVDGDVEWAETSADALETMSTPRGALGLDGPPTSAWVDPRGDTAYAAGHIKGAVHLPFARLEAEHAVALKDIDVIVVYDTDYDSALPLSYAKRLLALGYEDVYCLRGGLKAWQRDGHPIETGMGVAPKVPATTGSDGSEDTPIAP